MNALFSIRTRVALLAMGLVLVVVAVISGVAYREVESSALSVTREHMASVAQQLGGALSMLAFQTETQAAVAAADPAISQFLRERNPATSTAASAVLVALAKQTSSRVVELWDANGNRVFATNDTMVPARDELAPSAASLGAAPVRVNEIVRFGRASGYSVAARVGPATAPLGFVVERRPMATQASRAQAQQLIGSGANLFVGNAHDTVWTNFVDAAQAPAVRAPGNAEYDRPGIGRVVAYLAPIPHTPWMVAVETPRAASLTPAHDLLWRLALVTLLLVTAATLGAFRISAALTRPIVTLAGKAADLGAAEYDSGRVAHAGNDVGVLNVAFDTMASRVAEARSTLKDTVAELEDTETRYRMVFDASPQPMWVYDTETLRFLAVNDAAVSRYGHSRHEFLAMSVLEIVPPEGVPAAKAKLAVLGPRGGVESLVGRHRAKDGSNIEVEVSSRALSLDGRPARLVLTHDLTERRRAEESLRFAQERLERVLGSAGAVLYELRLEPAGTMLEWVSSNVTSILGYEIAEVHRDTWWSDNVNADDRVATPDRPAIDAYHDGAREYRFRHKDGRFRWIREEQRLLPGTLGEAMKVVGVWVDITDQRELEVQFRQSQKMEAIGRLAGGIAHDFNNLLTVIISESQFVLSQPGMPVAEQRDSLAEIVKAGERAAMLTRQLLSFSRRNVVDASTLDVNVVIADIDKMIRRLIGEDVDLKLIVSPFPVVTIVDRGQLEQVFVNLVVNARDAMPDGGMLTIETGIADLEQAYADTHSDVAPGRYATLAVTDSGTGMSDEVKAHVFEPFFTTKENGKGTGLGLATCYAIAKQFHGHISIYSEQGIGTTVKLYLPFAESETREVESQPDALQAGTETILLVEDEEPVRRIAARSLHALGYTVLEASNGDEALEVFARHGGEIDLLLSDVVMPGMGGRAIAERVRAADSTIAVLFVSGYSDDVILRHRLAGHDVVLLQKPFTTDALARKVREALAHRPSSHPAGESSRL